MAYQALSYAPKVALDQMLYSTLGDPSWSDEAWNHYLRAPGNRSNPRAYTQPGAESDQYPMLESLMKSQAIPDEFGEDLRYTQLSSRLVGHIDDPLTKAVAIVQYLSKESLYTRQPGHEVTKTGDPVAPYLFSEDKRGYCVHFAHAAVYLMRLAGIPSRIATGYLTDLSYAKDGHILLHLGDRHAWPEVYVKDFGWTVVDVTPENAENEPTLVPDENMLDDLMSKLNPVEDLLDPVPIELAEGSKNAFLNKLLQTKLLFALLFTILTAWLLLKSWLRLGYKIAKNDPRKQTHLAYVSFASLMADLGYIRYHGETRNEYADRLLLERGIDAKRITALNERNTYSKADLEVSTKILDEALGAITSSFMDAKSRIKRMFAFFSPLSITRIGTW